MNDIITQKYHAGLKIIQDRLLLNSLKAVLRRVGQSTIGRKQELRDRLGDYLKKGYARNDEVRISNVYRLVTAELHPVTDTRPPSSNHPPTGPRQTLQSSPHPSTSSNLLPRAASTLPPRPEPAPRLLRTSSIPSTKTPNIAPTSPKAPIPVIGFRESPFYKMKHVIGEPVLTPITGKEKTQKKITLRFNLTEPDISSIKNHHDEVLLFSADTSDATPEGTLLIYPEKCALSVNQQQINPQVFKRYKGIKAKKGTARAFGITKYLQLHPRMANLVDITVEETQVSFAFFVYLVRPVDFATLLENIKKRPYISKQDTVQKIREDNNDDDVEALSTVVSLKDPVSYSRIVDPVRSIHCDHIECFDASSFLQLQLQATSWTCPICNRPLDYESLAIDEYVMEILDTAKAYDLDEIEIDPMGAWNMPKDAKLLQDSSDSDSSSDTPPARADTISGRFAQASEEVIELLDSDDESLAPVPLMRASGTPSSNISRVQQSNADANTTVSITPNDSASQTPSAIQPPTSAPLRQEPLTTYAYTTPQPPTSINQPPAADSQLHTPKPSELIYLDKELFSTLPPYETSLFYQFEKAAQESRQRADNVSLVTHVQSQNYVPMPSSEPRGNRVIHANTTLPPQNSHLPVVLTPPMTLDPRAQDGFNGQSTHVSSRANEHIAQSVLSSVQDNTRNPGRIPAPAQTQFAATSKWSPPMLEGSATGSLSSSLNAPYYNQATVQRKAHVEIQPRPWDIPPVHTIFPNAFGSNGTAEAEPRGSLIQDFNTGNQRMRLASSQTTEPLISNTTQSLDRVRFMSPEMKNVNMTKEPPIPPKHTSPFIPYQPPLPELSKNPANGTAKRTVSEVIDLTLSDDEEEAPPSKR